MLDERLVCLYLDDSGQKSKGRFLVVAGIAVADYRAAISLGLHRAEQNSGKRHRDWHRTASDRRIAYLTEVCSLPELRGRVFYRIHTNTTPQLERLRADTTQDAIAEFAKTNRRAIHYEGLTRTNRENLHYELQRRGLKCEVRNAQFDRHPEVRLADALAGLIGKVRFSTDGTEYAHLCCDWFREL